MPPVSDTLPAASGPADRPLSALLWLALALSMGAAVSLGVTRFAYGLLLPVMRDDLHWSYTLAGAMNTANAAGYLLGALGTPWLMRRFGAARVLLGGALLASLFMAASGFFTAAGPLLAQRLLARAPGLTERELAVCLRLLRGMTHDGVAADLDLRPPTVKTYRNRAFQRLGIHFRNELFALVAADAGADTY